MADLFQISLPSFLIAGVKFGMLYQQSVIGRFVTTNTHCDIAVFTESAISIVSIGGIGTKFLGIRYWPTGDGAHLSGSSVNSGKEVKWSAQTNVKMVCALASQITTEVFRWRLANTASDLISLFVACGPNLRVPAIAVSR